MQLVTPLPIEAGVLLESGSAPTLVVKSTWIPGDDWARLAPVQLPLTRSIAHPDGVHLYYPGDFVPSRRRLDLILAGFRSDGRSTPIVTSVDDWYRRFRSVEPEGTEIAEAAMHTPEGEVFTRLVPVDAPTARYRARRWQFVDAALSLPLRRMPRMVRVEDQRGAVSWSFSETMHASIGAGAEPRALELSCDTIFVEMSTRTLVLVHRAELPARLPPHVVVALGPADAPPPTARGRLGIAVAEYEITSVEAAPYRPLNGWALPSTMRDETARLDSKRTFDAELPFGREGGRRPATVMSRPSQGSPSAAPSFDPNATIPAAAVPELVAQAMPFRIQPRAPVAPPAFAPPPRVASPIPPSNAPPPLAYPPPPPAERGSSPALAADPRVAASFLPAAPPVATAPASPPPAPPSGSMSLDEYARVRARLVAGATLDDALSTLGLAPAAYTALDRSVAQELAREAKAGRSELATRLKQLVRKAGEGPA